MNTRNAYSATVTIIALALLVGVLLQNKTAAEREGALSIARAQAESDKATIADLQKRISQVTAVAPQNDPRSADTQKEPRPQKPDESSFDRMVANNPVLQNLYVNQQTLRYPQRFGLFYASLDLSTDEIAEFERIMAEDFQSVIDVSVSAVSKGYKKDDTAAKKIVAEARVQRNNKLRALLGESGLNEFEGYEKNQAGKGLADTLAQNLYYTESPLDRGTALQLTRTVSDVLQTNGGQIKWDLVTSEAAKFMTPAQLAALNQHIALMANGGKVSEALAKAGVNSDGASR